MVTTETERRYAFGAWRTQVWPAPGITLVWSFATENLNEKNPT